MAGKLASREGFTLEDFLEQMMAIRKMGPIANLLGMLPGAGAMKEQLKQVDDRDLDRTAAIIRSMTPGRAGQPEDHQRLAAGPDRQRLRRQRHRRQPAAGAVRPGPEDDEPDGRQHGPAGHGPDVEEGSAAARCRPQSKKGKKGKGGKAKGGPARRPMGAPALPPGGLPGGGFPGGGCPGGMPGLPPGQGLPDLTKLRFDQPGDERPGR